MEIVSGRTGKPHVTSQQFRQIIEGIIGDDSCILPSGENLEPELVSNNSLKIRSGMMYHHGNVSSVKIGTYDEVELTNGSQGMKRIDLIVNRYTRNEEDNTEKNEWVVIMGTPAESNPVVPEYTQGYLQKGDLVDDCPAFEVHFDGINIVEVTKKLEIAKTNKELANGIAELTSNSFKCELTQLTAKTFRAAPKATAMRLDKQYDYSDFKMIGFCVINMSTSDSVTHRQWQWLPTQWLQDNLLNQSSSSSYANRRLIFNFSRGGGGQRAWICGSTNDGLNFIKGSDDTDNYDCAIFGLR